MKIDRFIKFVKGIDLTKKTYSQSQLFKIMTILRSNIHLETTREFYDAFGPCHISNMLNFLDFESYLGINGRQSALQKYCYMSMNIYGYDSEWWYFTDHMLCNLKRSKKTFYCERD